MNASGVIRIASALLLIALWSCAGPRYQTTYTYTPPESAEGRACVFQCENTKMQCDQLDQMRAANCQERASLEYQKCEENSRAEYERCRASGERVCLQSYCGRPRCGSSGQCQSQFHRCYETCGGQVHSSTQCVANCDGS